MSLAYCKKFWMGARGTTLLPFSLPISQLASSTGSPDQREGNHGQMYTALGIHPNRAATPGCLLALVRARARAY